MTTVAFASMGSVADPASYSGLPAGLCAALRRIPVEVVPIALGEPRLPERVARALLTPLHAGPGVLRHPRSGLIRAHMRTQHAPAVARLRAGAHRGAVAPGACDGLVQHGTEADLSPGVPFVTYEDSTVAQALRAYPYPELERAPGRALAAWRARAASLYGRAHACCATSRWAADSIVADYGVPSARVRVVGVGANLALSAPARSWAHPRFLFVGADWERKGGPGLLRAFAELRRSRPEAELHVVGRHPPLAAPGVEGHGFLDRGDPAQAQRLAGLYATATCLVLPSVHEPSASVLAEAAAAGLPSIGPASGGCATIVGDAGLLVDAAEPRALVEAMTALADGARAAQAGARAAARAHLFTWDAVAARLLEALGVGLPEERRVVPLT